MAIVCSEATAKKRRNRLTSSAHNEEGSAQNDHSQREPEQRSLHHADRLRGLLVRLEPVHHARALLGRGDEGGALDARARLVLRLHRAHHRLCLVALHEAHHAPAEAAAGDARAEHAVLLRRDLHEDVDLGRAHLEVVTQRRMALVQQQTHLLVVATLQRLLARQASLALRHHVQRAAVHHVAQRLLQRLHLLHRRVAQRAHLGVLRLQQRQRLLALRHAVGVLAARQLVLLVAVAHDDRHRRVRHRHQLALVRAAVDQQQIALHRARRDELVHDAARHAGEGVLRRLAQQRAILRGKRHAQDLLQEHGHRNLQRRRAAEPAANGHIRRNRHVEAHLLLAEASNEFVDDALLLITGDRGYGHIVYPTARLVTGQRTVSLELAHALHVGRNHTARLEVMRVGY